MQVDGGQRPVTEDEVLRVRRRAALAVQAVFAELGLPPISDAEVDAATVGLRSSATCPPATARPTSRRPTTSSRAASPAFDVARARDRRGFADVAEKILAVQRQRISGDYLQTAGDRSTPTGSCSRSTTPTTTAAPAPATASRASAGSCCRRCRTSSTRPALGGDGRRGSRSCSSRRRRRQGDDPGEVVVAVGPAFADAIRETIARPGHGDVLAAICDGIREAGATPRLVRVRRVADVAFIAHDGARLSGSGVALGIQSKGTAVIHRADLQPLDNLELFGMSPLYSLGVVPRHGAERGRLRARAAASGPCRPSSTTSRARS